MSRGRTLAQSAADVGEHRGYAPLIEMFFDSGILRLAISPWPLVVDGSVFTAAGALLEIDDHSESADGQEGLTFSLSGLTPGIIPLVVAEPYHRRLLRLMEARFDGNHVQVGAPTTEYWGRMVSLTSLEAQPAGLWTVAVRTEPHDAEARRPASSRFSDSDQRRRHPGDAGAEYAITLVERRLSRAPLGG